MTLPNQDSIRYVTASEIGISGKEQILIALEVIVKSGGSAKMSQIIEAVGKHIVDRDSKKRLSEQGKASLRFFINKVAVNADYIYKYDRRHSGWRITPKGRQYFYDLENNPQQYNKMLTPLGNDFQYALADVYTLLDADRKFALFDDFRSGAFMRSGVILTITAWETFIEDTLKAHFNQRIHAASDVNDVLNTFNSVVSAWVDSLQNKRPNPPDIALWTGEGWKKKIIEHFNKEILSFNTPKSDNIHELFKRYLGYDIKSIWKWDGTSSEEVCSQLDKLISLRGALVHRGRTNAEPTPSINRNELLAKIALVEQLVWSTEVELNTRLT